MRWPAELEWSWAFVDELMGHVEEPHFWDDLLGHESTRRLLAVTTRSVCRRWDITDAATLEDMASECSMVLFTMLRDPAANASAHRIRGGLAVALSLKFADRVKGLLESSAFTGSTGLSTRVRRSRALHRFAAAMAADGSNPSKAEVVEAYNAQVSARRSNAARQGALASVADFDSWTPVLLDGDFDLPVATLDDSPLFTTEARPLLDEVMVRARASGGVLGEVAVAWLDHFDAEPPYIATAAEVMASTGLTADEVEAAQGELARITSDVLAEVFGIGHA